MAEDEDLDRQEAEEEELEERDTSISADNFIGFLASWWRVVRPRFGRIFFAFALANALLQVAIITISGTVTTGTTTVGFLLFTGQFLVTAAVGGLLVVAAGYVRLETLQSRDRSMFTGLRYVGDMWGHIAAASLLTGLIAVLLLLAIGLVGLFLGLPLRLGPPVLLFVIAFEKYGLGPAWTRTRAIMKDNILRTFVYLLMLTLMAMVVLLLVQNLLATLLDQIAITNLGDDLVFIGVTIVLYALLDVALSAGLLVSYVDCRRREDEDFTIDELTEEEEEEIED